MNLDKAEPLKYRRSRTLIGQQVGTYNLTSSDAPCNLETW